MKPYLRWAGGKSWLTASIETIVGETKYKNYHEPFLGGGAMFFHLRPTNESYLSDLNEELIETYKAIRDDSSKVLKHLRKYSNTKEQYYKIRDKKHKNRYKIAARFIYLNRTSFNGIYRVNLKGKYNVPYGYKKNYSVDESEFKLASSILERASLSACDFNDSVNNIKKGDLVFLDPPYTVSHNDNGFIKYNQKLFSLEDQHRLKSYIDCIDARGAYYILTNAAHSAIDDIFHQSNVKYVLNRNSLIGGKKAKRGMTQEYVFTNIEAK